MPWYRVGTVAITAGQTTVTGTGTNFPANSRVGDAFQGPDGRWYEVTNIASATVISILPAYLGATVAAGSFGLAPMQGYVKESADRLRQLVDQFGATLAGLGAVSTENVLPVTKGGTGGTTAASAKSSLGFLTRNDYGLGASTSAFLEDSTTWQGNRFIGWSNANPAGPSASLISVGLDMGYAANRRFQIAVGGDGLIYARSALVSEPSDRSSWNAQFSALNSNMLPITAHLAASADNSQQLGVSQRRWSVVFASTGAINTSDAREKTPVRTLTANEVKAARLLAAEIGVYQWLVSVQEKGEIDARQHIGMTVQRSIEIMELCELDPFAYGFICYDAWEEEVEVIPAVHQEIINEEGLASNGALITPELRTVVTPAGDRYSFRTDQLNTFIAAGLRAESDELRAHQQDLEKRLAALESAA